MAKPFSALSIQNSGILLIPFICLILFYSCAIKVTQNSTVSTISYQGDFVESLRIRLLPYPNSSPPIDTTLIVNKQLLYNFPFRTGFIILASTNIFNYFYLEEGKPLIIREQNNGAISVKGQLQLHNVYLHNYLARYNINAGFDSQYRKSAGRFEQKEFVTYLENQKLRKEQEIDSISKISQHPLHKTYINFINDFSKYDMGAKLVRYAFDHPYYGDRKIPYSITDTISYKQIFKFAPLNNPEAANHPKYQVFVSALVEDAFNRLFFSSDVSNSNSIYLYKQLSSFLTFDLPAINKSVVQYEIIQYLIPLVKTTDEITFLSEEIKMLRQVNNDKNKVAFLNNELEKQSHLLPQKPSPDFSFKSISGESITLRDLVGKVVIIDFWATWCGPCLVAFPEMEKLQDKLKDEEVVFLFIALEEKGNEAKWVDFVNKNKKAGLHGILIGGFAAEEVRPFSVNSIPKYVLIDKNGILIDSNAPGPGELLEKMINALL